MSGLKDPVIPNPFNQPEDSPAIYVKLSAMHDPVVPKGYEPP